MQILLWIKHHLLQPQRGTWAVSLVHNLLKPVVRNNVEPIHGNRPGALSIRQAQPASDRLLNQGARVRSAQRHDGVEIGNVPALFQHVDVDHNLGRFIGVFHLQQPLDNRVGFRAGRAGIHLNHLLLVAALKKFLRLDQLQQTPGMCGVACNHQYEGLDDALIILARPGFDFYLGRLVQPYAILQLDLLQLLGRELRRVEILLRHHRRLLDEAILHCLRQRVVVNDILERQRRLARLHERRGRQLKTQHRLEFIDGTHTGRSAVAMRLVHQQHKIIQRGQIVEITLPDILR